MVATVGKHAAVVLPSGEQIPQSLMMEINFNVGTIAFNVGDIITFSVTTWEGTVLEVDGTTTAGNIHVRISEEGVGVPSPLLPLTLGEDILVNAVKNAEVQDLNGGNFYFQRVVTVGKNMVNQQEIDSKGASHVRFGEGTFHFDAMGKAQTSQQHKIAEYVPNYSELDKDMTDEIVAGGALVYDNDKRQVKLTTTTALNARYTRTSDEYHVHQAGVSQLIIISASIGDTGKADVRRRWGYYDDNNGIMFALLATQMHVMIRSSVTGSVVNTIVLQAAWNRDRLDGSGSEFNATEITLDVSKENTYWMDFNTGTIRFGVIVGGERILCHVEEESNINNIPFMSTFSLPVRYEQDNYTATNPASDSEMNVYNMSVFCEGAYNPFRRAFTSDVVTTTIASTTALPMLGIRPSEFYNTFVNRSTIYPLSFSIHNAGTVPVIFELYRNGTTAGGAGYVAEAGESTADLDATATSTSGGSKRKSEIIGAGATVVIDFPTFAQGRRGLRRSAATTYGFSRHVYAIRLLSGTTSCDVSLVFNWEEVRD